MRALVAVCSTLMCKSIIFYIRDVPLQFARFLLCFFQNRTAYLPDSPPFALALRYSLIFVRF